ncbi:MAG: hypothetical protein JW982_00615 [Spirochaetes bacterium]|nr:hypothetical protein [Spirochaetota bacterium]
MKFISEKNIFIIFLLGFLLFGVSLSADQTWRIFLSSSRLTFYSGNQINITVNVKNITESNLKFRIYNADYSTFQPVVFTMDGQEAPTSVEYRLKGLKVENVAAAASFREIELASGESFQYTFNLNDFYKIESGKKYKVRLFFMPAVNDGYIVRSENTVYIDVVNPPVRNESRVTETASGFTASEVLDLFLKAEKELRWKDYIKYLEPEKYISAFPQYARQYNAGDEVVKRDVLREFIQYLSTERYDYIVDYRLENEVYLPETNEAFVYARVKRYGGVKPFVYLYKYRLKSYKNYWLITDVEASVSRDY